VFFGDHGPNPKRAHKKREKRDLNPGHVGLIQECPCISCGEDHPGRRREAAHIRYSDAEAGKVNPGMGRKPDDRWTLPLCKRCHQDGPKAQHKGNERAFWERLGIDALDVARWLFARSREGAINGEPRLAILESMRAYVRKARRK
jgi:hypothetical protein